MRQPICEADGCNEPATDADHIERISDGGPRLDSGNLQSLCHSCHSRKTAHEGRRGDSVK
jgi:5-methylcytosine-specific restriction protein A